MFGVPGSKSWGSGLRTLRVQVPNNHTLTQNLYYNYYYPRPKYLIIGYMDPLGKVWDSGLRALGLGLVAVGRCSTNVSHSLSIFRP